MNLIFGRLSPEMDKKGFTCGEPHLDAYLHKQASQDMKRGFATIIAARDREAPNKIIGYYTLSPASVPLDRLPKSVTRKMPRYPNVPAILLGRLAVASNMQSQHIGTNLVASALRRAYDNELCWAIIFVDAKNERAAVFYEKLQFHRFEDNKLNLWMHRKVVSALVV